MAAILVLLSAALAWSQAAGAEKAGATAAPDSDKAKKAQAAFEAGRTLLFQGQHRQAVEKLTEAVKADPSKSGYKLLLAKAHRYAGQEKEAAALLEQILKDSPEHVEAGVELAEMLSARKDYDRVIKTLEPLLKFKHDYPLYHMLAEAYYQKEDMGKAREHFEEAVKLNPSSGPDFYQLANIYLAQSRFAKAAESYEKAQALGVDSAVLHFKLASVYFNLRNYLGRVATAEVIGGAVGQIKNELLLIDPVPGRKDTFYVSPPPSAIFQAAKAQQMGINVPQIRFLEANIWLSARRYAKADPVYKSLEGKLDKGDQGLFWYYWARTALGMNDCQTYLSRLDKAVEAEPAVYKPTLPDAYVTVARIYQQRGDNARYLEFLGKAVRANPLSAGLHLTFGDALWQLNQRAGAAEQYKLVLELEPDHAERIRLLNRIREQEGAAATQPSAARFGRNLILGRDR
jgi:tetratricopeptide (TPR) repeat protein